MTQLGPEMGDYSWVCPALRSDSLSDSVKEGLTDVLTALNLKKYAIPETAGATLKKRKWWWSTRDEEEEEEEASGSIKKKGKKKIGC